MVQPKSIKTRRKVGKREGKTEHVALPDNKVTDVLPRLNEYGEKDRILDEYKRQKEKQAARQCPFSLVCMPCAVFVWTVCNIFHLKMFFRGSESSFFFSLTPLSIFFILLRGF